LRPGGGTDIMARSIGQWLSEHVQFLIETRPGAGTTIATESVVRAPADGYTLIMIGTQTIDEEFQRLV
jgi:tripartite-type tricarboxylate transporter receptor subunit TctC